MSSNLFKEGWRREYPAQVGGYTYPLDSILQSISGSTAAYKQRLGEALNQYQSERTRLRRSSPQVLFEEIMDAFHPQQCGVILKFARDFNPGKADMSRYVKSQLPEREIPLLPQQFDSLVGIATRVRLDAMSLTEPDLRSILALSAINHIQQLRERVSSWRTGATLVNDSVWYKFFHQLTDRPNLHS